MHAGTLGYPGHSEPVDPGLASCAENQDSLKLNEIRWVDSEGRPTSTTGPLPSAEFVATSDNPIQESITVKTLQKWAGKCTTLTLVVPAAMLFTREAFLAISKAQKLGGMVPVTGNLSQEIEEWRFLDTWQSPMPR
ncbi:hypothetical protein Bbelb_291080 [Branchiostoma belcheri]|nr:hypothetical protein Bbelb_291080 [Branchiostoma belcheri]